MKVHDLHRLAVCIIVSCILKLYDKLIFIQIHMLSFFSGFLITFISKPVITGFTSAAAISIASSQLKSLFGLSYHSESVVETLSQLYGHINETRWQDLTLGLSCIVVLLLMRVSNV